MFTGIVEATGIVENVQAFGSNIDFTITCPFSHELKIDQSVAHNGCCLTVVKVDGESYTVTAIAETLEKTNLKYWKQGTIVNLERCLKLDSRLDGHLVQGHVDKTGELTGISDKNGSIVMDFEYGEDGGFITVPQGSITVNGISLTVASSRPYGFSVAIIPYTWEFTNLHQLKINDKVNLEFDIIGKYISGLMQRQK